MNSIEKFLKLFIYLMIAILGLILIYTTIEFIAVVIRSMVNRTSAFDLSIQKVEPKDLFMVQVQGLIAGVLLITIIIELIQSLVSYLKSDSHHQYLVVLYEISTIAIVRHLFIYDFHHLDGTSIIGIALLLLVLALINFFNHPAMMKRWRKERE